jgi:hypothetical protein
MGKIQAGKWIRKYVESAGRTSRVLGLFSRGLPALGRGPHRCRHAAVPGFPLRRKFFDAVGLQAGEVLLLLEITRKVEQRRDSGRRKDQFPLALPHRAEAADAEEERIVRCPGFCALQIRREVYPVE